MKIYKILKLVIYQSGKTLQESFKYEEAGFTKSQKLIDELKTIKVGEEWVWPLREMKGWSMYQFNEINLLEEYDSDDFVMPWR